MVAGRCVFVLLVLRYVFVLSQQDDIIWPNDGSNLKVMEEMVSRITEKVMAKLREELKAEFSVQQQCCQNMINSSQFVEAKMDACIAGLQPKAAVADPSLSSVAPECPPGFERFEGHCYLFDLTKKNWSDARKSCRQQKAYLVSVNSEEEHDFLITQIQKDYLTNAMSAFWLGLLVVENSLMWSDGTNLTYSNWYIDEEDVEGTVVEDMMSSTNDRVYISEEYEYKWVDNVNKDGLFYICELELANSLETSVPTPLGANGCVPGHSRFEDHCYSFEMTELTWIDARKACQESFNSSLVSINTEQEQNYLESQIRTYYKDKVFMYLWIGLIAIPGKLQWLDNSDVNYTEWENPAYQQVKYDNARYENCLNGQCKVSLWKFEDDIFWHSTSRREKHFYICEMDSI